MHGHPAKPNPLYLDGGRGPGMAKRIQQPFPALRQARHLVPKRILDRVEGALQKGGWRLLLRVVLWENDSSDHGLYFNCTSNHAL
jgi:hypothetical protein